jgi:hypothetical protein
MSKIAKNSEMKNCNYFSDSGYRNPSSIYPNKIIIHEENKKDLYS